METMQTSVTVSVLGRRGLIQQDAKQVDSSPEKHLHKLLNQWFPASLIGSVFRNTTSVVNTE